MTGARSQESCLERRVSILEGRFPTKEKKKQKRYVKLWIILTGFVTHGGGKREKAKKGRRRKKGEYMSLR